MLFTYIICWDHTWCMKFTQSKIKWIYWSVLNAWLQLNGAKSPSPLSVTLQLTDFWHSVSSSTENKSRGGGGQIAVLRPPRLPGLRPVCVCRRLTPLLWVSLTDHRLALFDTWKKEKQFRHATQVVSFSEEILLNHFFLQMLQHPTKFPTFGIFITWTLNHFRSATSMEIPVAKEHFPYLLCTLLPTKLLLSKNT